MFTPGRTMTVPFTRETVNSLSNRMEEPVVMSPLKISRWGCASLFYYLTHTWACLPPLSTSFHLGKGGGPLLQYQVERPHLGEAHLTTGTPQEKGERGNPSSVPVAPAGKRGRCSHCRSQTVDPTAKHPTLPIHCIARVPQWGSG